MAGTHANRWTRRKLLHSGVLAGAVAAAPHALRAADLSSSYRLSVAGADALRARALAHGLMYGAAVAPELLDLNGLSNGSTSDPYTQLIAGQCNILVGENAMKWGPIHPSPTSYNFGPADKLVRFAALAGQRVRGHNLCWHEALPNWFQTTATRENARNLLVQHIQTVAGRYRGQIHSWDVVNEAVESRDGRPDGLRVSPWLNLIGPEYIELAFTTAAAVDPGTKLTYNETHIELDTPEESANRAHTLMLLRRLKARNVPVHAVGIQSHLQANGPQPGNGLLTFVREIRKLGLEVYITEMDVNTHALEGGPEAQDYAVSQVYRNYLGMLLPEPNVAAVLTWGITNGHTWLNDSNEKWVKRPDGARQRPLPFDDSMQPTPVFAAIRVSLDASRPLVQTKEPDPLDPATLYKPFRVLGSPGSPLPAPAGNASKFKEQ